MIMKMLPPSLSNILPREEQALMDVTSTMMKGTAGRTIKFEPDMSNFIASPMDLEENEQELLGMNPAAAEQMEAEVDLLNQIVAVAGRYCNARWDNWLRN